MGSSSFVVAYEPDLVSARARLPLVVGDVLLDKTGRISVVIGRPQTNGYDMLALLVLQHNGRVDFGRNFTYHACDIERACATRNPFYHRVNTR